MAFADRNKEERFLAQHRDDTAEHLRWACLLGAAIMIGFMWQDTLMSTSGYKAINIRLFGALPFSALAWYLSRNLGVRRFIYYISAFFWLSYACFTAAIFIIYEPGPYGLTSSTGLGSFLLILFGVFTFSNLRFWASLLVGLLILLVYTVSVVLWAKVVFVDFIMGDFLTAVALVIGAAAKTLFTDRARRRLFETSELLSESYTTVEQQVRERTTELTDKITEHKLAEEALRESEEKYRMLVD
jgi:PAS domain-containing protein